MERKKIVTTHTMQEGEFLEKKFSTYLEMAKNAVDWTIFCHYKLHSNHLEGFYKILQLKSIQLSFMQELGGVMYDFAIPKESLCLSFMLSIEDKACIREMKLETGMVLVTQSEKIYNIILNKGLKVIDISITKSENPQLYTALKPYVDKFFYTKDKALQKKFLTILEQYSGVDTLDTHTVEMIEKDISQSILNELMHQEPLSPKFSKSEQKALTIRSQIFHHMDNTLTVHQLAIEHQISEKSLQSAFKSLYGFTPIIFIRYMKLNLVNHELLKSDSKDATVLAVASKWGFKHMGRFSAYYKELFLESPKETLKKVCPLENGMSIHCVERQEELS